MGYVLFTLRRLRQRLLLLCVVGDGGRFLMHWYLFEIATFPFVQVSGVVV